jgi:hypothetical protein
LLHSGKACPTISMLHSGMYIYVYLCMFRESLFNIYKGKLTCSLICVSGCTGITLTFMYSSISFYNNCYITFRG